MAIAFRDIAERTKTNAMTSTTQTPRPFDTAPMLEPLRAKWGWIVALGAFYMIAGFVALGSVVTATVVSVFVVGIMMLVAGVAEVLNAFQVKTWGNFVLWVLLGALYIIAGFVTLENPVLAAAVLTLVLSIALIASGVTRIILAFSMKEGVILIVLSGVITLVLGIVILAHWPVSSLYILGLFLGVDLLFAGAGWIGLGLGLRRRGMA